MNNFDKILKICIGMFLCLICTGSPVSMSAIKISDWPLYIPRSIGTILGALFAGATLNYFGRRKLLIFSGLWVLLTVDFQPWLHPETFFYLHGLSGFGYGMIFVIYIVYISETVCAKYRGFAVSLNCAARTISGSIVVLLYNSERSIHISLKIVTFIILVVLSLAGLKCILIYNQETHVFRIQQNRANNDELESNPNPIIDQEIEGQIEPSEHQLESNSHNTDLLENDLLSKSNILMKHPFKLYLKSILLVFIFRLPLLMVQNCVFSLLIYGSVVYVNFENYYSLLLLALVPILVTAGYRTGTTYRRKSIFLVNIFIITLFLFVISGLMMLMIQHEMKMIRYFVFPMFVITQIVSSAGLFHCSDLLLADFLPLKYRSLNVAIIFCIEHLIKFCIYFEADRIDVYMGMEVFLFISAIISAFSGIVMYFKFDSLYAMYQ